MKMTCLVIFTTLLFLCGSLTAQTIAADRFMVWGLGEDQIVIPVGSVITEAVLTIVGASSLPSGFTIHLLDDTNKGFYAGVDSSGLNYFAGFGVPLKGTLYRGTYTCKLSQNNDLTSSIWSIFSSPCKLILPDASSVNLTSSTLLLNDYAGNSRGFGIGLDPGNANFTFRYMKLVLTLRNYQGTAGTSQITYKLVL